MSLSISSITQKEYRVPEDLDDSVIIEEFLLRNEGKTVVVVQGLGFVGAVMALVCANAVSEDYAVIGVDLANESSFWKIRSINEGVFPLVAEDPKIDDFFKNAREKGNFLATYDPAAYGRADVIVVDINLDVQKYSDPKGGLEAFDVTLEPFKAGVRSIAANCKEDVLIIIETTVPPGTTELIAKPILEAELTMRGKSLKNYRLGHSYERVMPGPQYIDSIREFPRVYAGINEESANAVEGFLNTIIDSGKCELTRLGHTNATEMAKVLENSYRALNIAFAVEWSRFAEEAGVDLYSVVSAIRVRPTHANLMLPGLGVGGYCLTKDPLLASWSRKSFFGSASELEMSVRGVSINDQMPRFAFERLITVFGSLADKLVAFLGVSYRGDVGDTRFSPVEPLVNLVRESGGEILLHDPFVPYWEEQQCRITSELTSVTTANPDVIVISAGHGEYKTAKLTSALMAMKPSYIFDAAGLLSSDQIALLSGVHEVSGLGRGDM